MLMMGGQSVGDAIADYGSRIREAKANRQMLIDGYGVDEDEVDAMPAAELKGAVQGYAIAAQQKTAEAQRNYMQAHASELESYGRYRDAQAAAAARDSAQSGLWLKAGASAPPVMMSPDTRSASLLDDAAGQGESPYGNPASYRPANLGEAAAYASRTVPDPEGRNFSRNLDSLTKFYEAQERARQAAGGNGEPPYQLNFGEDPVSGNRYATYGKSVMASGFDPAMATANTWLVPQHNDDGELVGWTQADRRGNSHWIPNKSGSPVLRQAVTPEGAPLNGQYVDSNGKPHDLRTAMEKTIGPTVGAAAKPGAAKPGKTPLVTTQEQFDKLKSGDLYKESDGKTYRKP